MTEQVYIWVRRQWNDYRKAKYKLGDISNVHWDNISGGVYARAPQYFLHGYVWCNEMLEGELAHSGIHGDCSHNIKVCIVKKDNAPEVYARLTRKVGPKPQSGK